ncbi:hypothetical protein BGW80DRAFT_286142 [Lactifluus volemus]|nr:hypothetical protein BGW80DRAFT_286142 [Lactifluus volemus]
MDWVGGFAQPTTTPVLVAPLHTQDDDSEHLVWFAAIDQDNSGRISAEELQSALMTGNGQKRFSSDTVRYLMNVFDLDGNGEIGVEEFKPLWNYVKQWREMFDSFDDNKDGIIDARELATALGYYDMHMDPSVIDMLIRKYGTSHRSPGHKANDSSPKIELDRFVCACVVVQQLCQLYDRCGAIQAGVSRDEFLLAVLRLP